MGEKKGKCCPFILLLFGSLFLGLAFLTNHLLKKNITIQKNTNFVLDAAQTDCTDIDIETTQLTAFAGATPTKCVGFTANYVVEDNVYNTKFVTDDWMGGRCSSAAARVQMYQWRKVQRDVLLQWVDGDPTPKEARGVRIPGKLDKIWEWPGTQETDRGWNAALNVGPMYFVGSHTAGNITANLTGNEVYVKPLTLPYEMFTGNTPDVVSETKLVEPFCISHAHGRQMATDYPNGMNSTQWQALDKTDTTKFPVCTSATYGDYKFMADCRTPNLAELPKRRVIGGGFTSTDGEKAMDGWQPPNTPEANEFRLFHWTPDLQLTTAGVLKALQTSLNNKYEDRITILKRNRNRVGVLGGIFIAVGLLKC